MPCKQGVVGLIPGFSRTASGQANGCSCHKIHIQIVNPPGPVLFTTQGKPQKKVSLKMLNSADNYSFSDLVLKVFDH